MDEAIKLLTERMEQELYDSGKAEKEERIVDAINHVHSANSVDFALNILKQYKCKLSN
jgi:hypothetical protein